jgi:hypothetical protein
MLILVHDFIEFSLWFLVPMILVGASWQREYMEEMGVHTIADRKQ